MAVKKIVANIASDQIAEVRAFYEAVFELDMAMDLGWICTMTSGTDGPVQMSIAREGGSGTQVPDLSIEVDDLDDVYTRATALGHTIEYPMTTEPWGVRRFYLRDPAGKVLNVLSH